MDVARNPVTPPATLAALAADPASDVRAGVAGNPSAPPAALAVLAHAPGWGVRDRAARNPSLLLARFYPDWKHGCCIGRHRIRLKRAILPFPVRVNML